MRKVITGQITADMELPSVWVSRDIAESLLNGDERKNLPADEKIFTRIKLIAVEGDPTIAHVAFANKRDSVGARSFWHNLLHAHEDMAPRRYRYIVKVARKELERFPELFEKK